jgi:hypothetical protein
MTDILRPIPESYWIQPGRFLAGEYPSAAYIGRASERLGKLIDAGISSFLDLTLPGELPPYRSLLLEQARQRGIEVDYNRITILDRSIPTRATMTAILDAIDDKITSGRNLYLHCWGGIGRTGTTVGCYLVRHGMTGEQALAQLSEWWKDVPKSAYYPRSPETDRQVEFILKWREDRSWTPPSPQLSL